MLPINGEDDDDTRRWWHRASDYLNFYRIHVMYYVFTPLIFSGIFYASNGRYHVSYIDALFNCVSAMTVCGLATINLSALTGWQQGILFIQMCIGNPIVVSWVVVYQRRRHLAMQFRNVLKVRAEEKKAAAAKEKDDSGGRLSRLSSRISTLIRRSGKESLAQAEKVSGDGTNGRSESIRRVRPDMIRRVDEEPRLVNPSGFAVPTKKDQSGPNVHLSFALPPSPHETHARPIPKPNAGGQTKRGRRLSDPGSAPRAVSPIGRKSLTRTGVVPNGRTVSLDFPGPSARGPSVEFVPNVPRRRGRMIAVIPEDEIAETERPQPDPRQHEHRTTFERRTTSLSRQSSLRTHHTNYTSRTRLSQNSKHTGFGFFPVIPTFHRVFDQIFPKLGRTLTRTMTVPVTTSLVSQQADVPPGAKAVPYISFDAVVGRNSTFRDLSDEEMEELGGVEYRALTALLWIVGGYHCLTQLAAFTVIAPYISMAKWSSNFLPPIEIRPVHTAWFSIFQCVSAYTNTGISLVDTSMLGFQTAYPMIFFLAFLILAGNTAFPVFLRFTIWILTKCVPTRSRANETLHFLLDHPRRCYIYLFPSHQTWFLLTIVCLLTTTDWFFFLVLDIGNTAVEKIPLGTRFAIGFFQSTAVRSAGFAAVNIAALTAGVKVLYVVMMYISVYPIAMSIRSTNVYEEQSLGIFPEDTPFDEEDFEHTGSRVAIWSRYLAMHARKQLAFDMWWIGLAVFVLCIIEKSRLDDPSNAVWFNIFSIVFDLVSAYGTVGLSLGVPFDNYSFAGALKPLSKLILCVVMIRGRHRGLPMAIDRAVMLPSEFQRFLDQDDRSQYTYRPSNVFPRESENHETLLDKQQLYTSPRTEEDYNSP